MHWVMGRVQRISEFYYENEYYGLEVSKKWTMSVRDWGLAYAQFAIFFEDRFAA